MGGFNPHPPSAYATEEDYSTQISNDRMAYVVAEFIPQSNDKGITRTAIKTVSLGLV